MNFRDKYYCFWGIFFIVAEILARRDCLFVVKCHPLRLLFLAPYRMFRMWCLTLLSIYYIINLFSVIISILVRRQRNSERETNDRNTWRYFSSLAWVRSPSDFHVILQWVSNGYYSFVFYSSFVVSVLHLGLIVLHNASPYIHEVRFDSYTFTFYEIFKHAGTVLPLLFEYYTFRSKEMIHFSLWHGIVMCLFCGAYVGFVIFGKYVFKTDDFPFRWGFPYGWSINHYFFPWYFGFGLASIWVMWALMSLCIARGNSKKKRKN